ncbi:MAG: hypothetical protein MJ211_11560 [Bacteroidales bacterium]|nr:hypothetical protein [Bacteroidales bacterium]
MDKVNFNFSGKDILRHLLRIGISIGCILIVWQYYKPKDFILSTFICMLIYIFVSLIVESIFNSKNKNKK